MEAAGLEPAGISNGRGGLRRAIALGALLALGCSVGPEPPDARWQPGALLVARRAPLEQLLRRVERIEGTPLARAARALRTSLPDCPEIEAVAQRASGLTAALRCAGPDSPLAGPRAYLDGADRDGTDRDGVDRDRAGRDGDGEPILAAALPVGPPERPRVVVRAVARRGDVHVSVRWPAAATGDGLAALLPGAEPAGPEVLGEAERLLHARVRGDGPLDLAALVPADSQADGLFHLKSDLLSSAVLDGTWEAALYLPDPGARMPGIAAALGVRLEAAASEAAERLLDEVESHWPVRRAPVHRGDLHGACLLELNLLPELAPCYVTTRGAIVLAWNPASLRRALAAPASAGAGPTGSPGSPGSTGSTGLPGSPGSTGPGLQTPAAPPGRLEIDLARLREADRRLAARSGGSAGGAPGADLARPARWPWRRIRAEGARRRGGLTLELRLEARPDARAARDAASQSPAVRRAESRS